MDESDSTKPKPGLENPAAPQAVEVAPNETSSATAVASLPMSLDVSELQSLGPEEIERLCRDFELRVNPARTRHHHILDLIRTALGLGIPVTATGFFDQVADSFGVLRWPRLNFLAVPEDVGVSRALIQKFHLKPAQTISGTLRLPRDAEKILMLAEVLASESLSASEWT